MEQQYLALCDVEILCGDELNLITRVRPVDSKDDVTSIFHKVYMNISKFNNEAMMYANASCLTMYYIANKEEFKANKGVAKNDLVDTIYGIFYKTDNDNEIHVRLELAHSVHEESVVLDDLQQYAESHKSELKEDSVIISRVGNLIRSDINKQIEKSEYTVKFDEQQMAGLIMKKGADSFKEFNHKIYTVVISEEAIEDGSESDA